MRKKNSPTSPAWRGNFRIFSSKLPLQFSTSFLESGRFQKAKMLENRINPGFFYLSFGRTHHFWKENTKTALLLLQWRCFLSLGGTSWQRGTAAPRAVRVVGACSPVGCVQARPRRQPRQVLLPLPQNRRKHWVSAGFLFACVAWEWGSFWFGHWVFSSGFTRSQLFPSPPAPKTHPVSPFSAQTGCFFLFFAVFWLQNFCPGFFAPCCIAFTN